MFRWTLCVVLAVAIAAVAAWQFDLLSAIFPEPTVDPPPPVAKKPLGAPLYAPAPPAELPMAPVKVPHHIVIDACHLVARHKQEVSCPKEGQILFLGEEVTGAGLFALGNRPLEVAFITLGDNLVPCLYQPWHEGDSVDQGQVLALVDPSLAMSELVVKAKKVEVAIADHKSTVAIFEEAAQRFDRTKNAYQISKGVTIDDLEATRLAKEKYKIDCEAKISAIKAAEAEMAQAETTVQQYRLRSAVNGKAVIKKIAKQPGDGIHAFETVMQLQGLSHLRVEGAVDGKYLTTLKHGMRCYLEPAVETHPSSEPIQAQISRINSVAVCADGMHFVSASEDKTLAVWERGFVTPLKLLGHASPVRVAACSPTVSGKNWLLVGCADGAIFLYDLANPAEPKKLRSLTGQHRGGVSALAFSPDGTYFASGGEDNSIVLWRTADGEVVYAFDAEHGVSSEDAHQGTVTSLHFTPQAKLISAGRDNTLRVWGLHEKGARLDYEPILHRSGTVSQLGVSQDGRYMLFEQGKSLRLLRVADGRTAAVLENLAGAATFETLALFSPEGSLMLTGGAEEGRLQLWHTPEPGGHGFQVRELVTTDRAMITCAAFAPAGVGFAVTGSKEGFVHVWTLPTAAEVQAHRISVDGSGAPLRVDLLERSLDGGKARIAVNLVNPQDRLVPGQRATLVVPLE
jgi:WD40 repeat protein